ncbi:MAG: YggT family protein [Candidatus Omnitrophica bacterium]|nr:YggT family protein [Candidatus Omnitrophota bacterium]
MFVLSNLFAALATVVSAVLNIAYWLILVRALISWVNPDPSNFIVQFLERVTEPVLAPVRRMLPPMAIDLSPIVVFLIIMFLQKFLVPTLFDIGFAVR